MNVRIDDVMAHSVITTNPHTTVEAVRNKMSKRKVHALPVVDADGEVAGIITSTDLARPDLKDGTPVSAVMTERVFCLPRYNDASAAATVMRKHRIHHVVVTHEKQVVGILSAFDLLQLVEGRKFVAKNKGGGKKRDKGKKRGKANKAEA